ncbi:MAG: multidrug effflux MFS transporter [Reichenbachiella sp.]
MNTENSFENNKHSIGPKEFITLMAILMSMLALAIDAILPALNQIAQEFSIEQANDIQLMISTTFIGMAAGLMLYGPLSDSYGRKNALYLGIVIFSIGNVLSLFSTNYTWMIAGRIIQGFGAASCRVVTGALIRDTFKGNEMGKVMSLIMTIFIIIPAVAPVLGQGILLFAEWRSIFTMILCFGILGLVWLHFRQPETLVIEKRLRFSFPTILSGIWETLRNPIALSYTIVAGIIFGAFIGYLSTSQQMLQNQYQLGESFSLYIGGLAIAVGIASYINSKIVMRFGMTKLSLISLTALTFLSGLFYLYVNSTNGHPPLWTLMTYLTLTFFCFGILFGSLNALAVEPLGHIAGVANSVISATQTLISVFVGGVIGYYYNDTVQPLVIGFLSCGVISMVSLIPLWLKSRRS